MKKYLLFGLQIIGVYAASFVLVVGVGIVFDDYISDFVWVVLFLLPTLIYGTYVWYLKKQHSNLTAVIVFVLLMTIYLFPYLLSYGQLRPNVRAYWAMAKANLTMAQRSAESYATEHGGRYSGICNSEDSVGEYSGDFYPSLMNAASQDKDFAKVNINQRIFSPAKLYVGVCNDSDGYYGAEVVLKKGPYFCIDSSGKSQENKTPGLTATDDYNCDP